METVNFQGRYAEKIKHSNGANQVQAATPVCRTRYVEAIRAQSSQLALSAVQPCSAVTAPDLRMSGSSLAWETLECAAIAEHHSQGSCEGVCRT